MDVERFNQTKQSIESLRKVISNKAESDAVCSILQDFNDRIAALEQEANPGNAFIPFTPATTATPIR